mmetsp:Transcript_9724/g.39371  ORF Transcript_9724/g.39371 Transcript_9724/m.39371 type:complete len:267 (-) Transcript_9724:1448-2248(-)
MLRLPGVHARRGGRRLRRRQGGAAAVGPDPSQQARVHPEGRRGAHAPAPRAHGRCAHPGDRQAQEGCHHRGEAVGGSHRLRRGGGMQEPGEGRHDHERLFPGSRARQALHGAQGSPRRRALHPAVQLPGQPGGVEDRARAHRRQRVRGETADAGVRQRADDGAVLQQGPGPAEGPRAGGHRARRGHRRLHGGAPGRQLCLVHRRRHRPRGVAQGPHGPGADGAGREGRGARVSGRGPRPGGDGDRQGGVQLQRPAVHRREDRRRLF